MEDLVTATETVLCAVASMDIQETAVKHLQVYTVYRIYLLMEYISYENVTIIFSIITNLIFKNVLQ